MTDNGIDYTNLTKPSRTWRLGVVRVPFVGGNDEAAAMFEAALQPLKEFIVIDPVQVAGADKLFETVTAID
jgi:hypothetical protein